MTGGEARYPHARRAKHAGAARLTLARLASAFFPAAVQTPVYIFEMSGTRSRRPRVPASAVKEPADKSHTSLRLSAKPELLTALLREHRQLLTKIKQRKTELQRLTERIQTTMSEFASKAQPLMTEIKQLDRELHLLFAGLLARQQPRRTRATVRRIYRMLQDDGVLSPQGGEDFIPEFVGPEFAQQADELPEGSCSGPQRPPLRGEDSYSAQRPREPAEGQTLRGLFHRLATAIHPDKAQHEAEKASRTEAMKEVTRAYHDGDLARLLDLERTWMTSGELPADSDELSRRCGALRQTNAALRTQLAQLTSELRELRHSPPAELLSELQRATRRHGVDPIAAALEEATEDLGCLRELLDFVRSYRDGEIDLDEFMQGPPSTRMDEAGDDLLEILESMLKDLDPPRRKKGRRSPRSGHVHDVSF